MSLFQYREFERKGPSLSLSVHKYFHFCGISYHIQLLTYAMRTQTDFLSLGAPRKSHSEGPIYYQIESAHLAHTPNFLSELLYLTMAGEVSLLDNVTPIFCRTEVSAHGLIFYCKQIFGRKGPIFSRTKSQGTRTNFHFDFFSTIKIRSLYAVHY